MTEDKKPYRGLDLTDLSAGERINPEPEPIAPQPVPNPEQKAVALKYEREKDPAPKIVATGRGAVAEQILQLAFASGVKVREDADLVEVLSHLEIDTPIPLEAYAAVAEILAYVYKANAQHLRKTP